MPIADGRPYNHYQCQICGEITVTKHEDDGTTPFMIGCRATKDCQGVAHSVFYSGPQNPDQVPHLIWWRPKSRAQLERALQAYSPRDRRWLRDHVEKGGCLMRLAGNGQAGEIKPIEAEGW